MPGPKGTGFTGGRGSGDMVWIEMPNAEQAVGRIRQAGAGLSWQMDKVIGFFAQDIADAAKDLVPKDEHKVEKNIRTQRRADAWYVVADRGGDRDEVPIYLEIGTHKMAARPFMKPAARLTLASGGLLKANKKAGGLLGRTNV